MVKTIVVGKLFDEYYFQEKRPLLTQQIQTLKTIDD